MADQSITTAKASATREHLSTQEESLVDLNQVIKDLEDLEGSNVTMDNNYYQGQVNIEGLLTVHLPATNGLKQDKMHKETFGQELHPCQFYPQDVNVSSNAGTTQRGYASPQSNNPPLVKLDYQDEGKEAYGGHDKRPQCPVCEDAL